MMDGAASRSNLFSSATRIPARHALALLLLVIASLTYLGGCFSPPSLMDDVDSVNAQIARNMLSSGDWVTARLDGVAYLEKAPLPYWLEAISFRLLGAHDWAARLPFALSAIALVLVVYYFASWALGERAGFWAGSILATCVGLWLFTRIQIPDVCLTLAITITLWSLLRILDKEERMRVAGPICCTHLWASDSCSRV